MLEIGLHGVSVIFFSTAKKATKPILLNKSSGHKWSCYNHQSLYMYIQREQVEVPLIFHSKYGDHIFLPYILMDFMIKFF
jgi:hypothetical protein